VPHALNNTTEVREMPILGVPTIVKLKSKSTSTSWVQKGGRNGKLKSSKLAGPHWEHKAGRGKEVKGRKSNLQAVGDLRSITR